MRVRTKIGENGIEEENLVDYALWLIRNHEPDDGYYVAFSGGKDSIVIRDLVKRAGVKHDIHYNLTTVDPPELVQFIKTFDDVQIDKPEKTMWQLIVENGMPPLRQMRYCCRILKERGGEDRFKMTGVRWAESPKRKEQRDEIEGCFRESKGTLNPIVSWSDSQVWQYIKDRNLRYCKLYDEGWKRLGCVLCPNADQQAQAKRWTKLADAYKRACVRAYDKAIEEGKKRSWDSGEEMYYWWISGQPSQEDKHSMEMF